MESKKQAYLIIAHNNFEILEYLIKLIDYEKNDIYIHVDKKVKKFDEEKLRNFTKYSNIKIFQNFDIKWGDISQVQCEIFLLEMAKKNNDYSYYHLLSRSRSTTKTY